MSFVRVCQRLACDCEPITCVAVEQAMSVLQSSLCEFIVLPWLVSKGDAITKMFYQE